MCTDKRCKNGGSRLGLRISAHVDATEFRRTEAFSGKQEHSGKKGRKGKKTGGWSPGMKNNLNTQIRKGLNLKNDAARRVALVQQEMQSKGVPGADEVLEAFIAECAAASQCVVW